MAAPADTRGPAWDTLRGALDTMQAVAGAPRASHVELGKAFAAVASAMLEVAHAAGQTSVRYSAVAKALELRTKKSLLEAFVGGEER